MKDNLYLLIKSDLKTRPFSLAQLVEEFGQFCLGDMLSVLGDLVNEKIIGFDGQFFKILQKEMV